MIEKGGPPPDEGRRPHGGRRAEGPLSIAVHARACRGCGLCVETCPTQVLALDDARGVATVARVQDCIGCLSCAYRCPSGALAHEGVHVVKNFYRDLGFADRLGRYL